MTTSDLPPAPGRVGPNPFTQPFPPGVRERNAAWDERFLLPHEEGMRTRLSAKVGDATPALAPMPTPVAVAPDPAPVDRVS